MQIRKVDRGTSRLAASGAQKTALEHFYESVVCSRLTVAAVYGALDKNRLDGTQVRALCPLHERHEFSVDISTKNWVCHGTDESGGPLDFLSRLFEATGVPARDARQHAIVELARRCHLHPPRDLPPPTPAPSEAATIWDTLSVPVLSDSVVTCWLERHGVIPGAVDSYDVMRVIPSGAKLPRWAEFTLAGERCSWPQAGARVVVPIVDALGALRSLMFCSPMARRAARCVAPPVTDGVFADATTCHVLASRSSPRFLRDESAAIVVVRGLLPFLRQITGRGACGTAFTLVLGVIGDGLPSEVVARLPRNSRVISAIDRSADGERVHESLRRSIVDMRPDLVLSRWSA